MKKTTARVGFIGFVNLAAVAAILFCPIIIPLPASAATPPVCLDKTGNTLAQNNAQVLDWKTSTPNQYLARAHVTGIIQKIYPNETGHAHFSIALDQGTTDTLEVIYNIEFGKLPALAPGMQIEACGDFINSDKATQAYPASPDGAIIHWIHQSTSHNHQSGYVSVNGVVYGLLSHPQH